MKGTTVTTEEILLAPEIPRENLICLPSAPVIRPIGAVRFALLT